MIRKGKSRIPQGTAVERESGTLYHGFGSTGDVAHQGRFARLIHSLKRRMKDPTYNAKTKTGILKGINAVGKGNDRLLVPYPVDCPHKPACLRL